MTVRFFLSDTPFCCGEYATERMGLLILFKWNDSLSKLVTEEAFVRIAPAVSGVVDLPTVHNLFKALAGDQEGISMGTWLAYIHEFV
ncbi:hypothetical protein A2U01_0028294, partial [Trifolium medium]|nr:hypothetical protein [Trifolium medium]